jgi:hypothetical protein
VAVSELDRWATLNVEMDANAKKHMHMARTSLRHFMVTVELWSVCFNGKKIITSFTDTIYDLEYVFLNMLVGYVVWANL